MKISGTKEGLSEEGKMERGLPNMMFASERGHGKADIMREVA